MQRQCGEHESLVEADRTDALQRQIDALSSRDWQLWSIGILVMLVISAGLLAVVFPSMSWHRNTDADGRMLPQFYFGFIALIILFNVYAVAQKRTVNSTRHELIRELVFSERMESMSMMDPITQILNLRGVEQALTHELARANRLGTDLTLMIMRLESLPVVNGRFGSSAGNKFLADVARLLKTTFRGSDIVARISQNEFLAVLPNTKEPQAECAQKRIEQAIDDWNLSTRTGCEISFAYGIMSYVTGTDAHDLLRAAQRKALAKGHSLIPVFVAVENDSGESQMMI